MTNYIMGRKDMRLSGYLMPGAEDFDEGYVLKQVLIDGFEKEIRIIVPKDLLTEEKNESMLHVEMLAENNFHSSDHAMVYDITVKELNEIPEQKNINFCKIKGEICFLHVYRDKVDLMVRSKSKGRNGKAAFIPISCKKGDKTFYLGKYVRVYGHLIERCFQKDGTYKVVLEVQGEYVY